jgi:hypothetical protein
VHDRNSTLTKRRDDLCNLRRYTAQIHATLPLIMIWIYGFVHYRLKGTNFTIFSLRRRKEDVPGPERCTTMTANDNVLQTPA